MDLTWSYYAIGEKVKRELIKGLDILLKSYNKHYDKKEFVIEREVACRQKEEN